MYGSPLVIILFCLFLYFIPAIVGSEKRNRAAIFILNLFLGWTLIGWVIALVWAVAKDTPAQQIIANQAENKNAQ